MATYDVRLSVRVIAPFYTLVKASSKREAVVKAVKKLDASTLNSSDFFGDRITFDRKDVKVLSVVGAGPEFQVLLGVNVGLVYGQYIVARDPAAAKDDAVAELLEENQAVDFNGQIIEFDDSQIEVLSVRPLRSPRKL